MKAYPLTRTLLLTVVLVATYLLGSSAGESSMNPAATGGAERHLKNIRQLTFGRQNAEAYFSFDGTKLIFQSTNNWMKDSFAATLKPAEEGLGCYQMYVMDLESATIRLVSTGTGATTCGYFSQEIGEFSIRPHTRRDRTARRSPNETGRIAGRWMIMTCMRFASTDRRCNA